MGVCRLPVPDGVRAALHDEDSDFDIVKSETGGALRRERRMNCSTSAAGCAAA